MQHRYFIRTTYNAETGEPIVHIMQRPLPYADAVSIETFRHEWRAEKRLLQLIQEAHQRGEHTVCGVGTGCGFTWEKEV